MNIIGTFPNLGNRFPVTIRGAGKSTVLLDWVCNMQAQGKKVLFISGEMNDIDMYGYVKRFPKFGKVPIMFMGDYSDCSKQAVEQVLDSDRDWETILFYLVFTCYKPNLITLLIYLLLDHQLLLC